jgi:hypothetical protein
MRPSWNRREMMMSENKPMESDMFGRHATRNRVMQPRQWRGVMRVTLFSLYFMKWKRWEINVTKLMARGFYALQIFGMSASTGWGWGIWICRNKWPDVSKTPPNCMSSFFCFRINAALSPHRGQLQRVRREDSWWMRRREVLLDWRGGSWRLDLKGYLLPNLPLQPK